MPKCLLRYETIPLLDSAMHFITVLVIIRVICFFQLLTNHYERCWKYYCLPNGWANFGVSSEEELHLTRKLFWGIFESLAHKVSSVIYDKVP